ncbi:MAG: SLATT domain-containing protein [Sphingomonadales bacterium]|nr:MAG: SLATT domain-containing protein [Sphingomonadales bacterium]
MMPIGPLEDQIRECFGRVVYTHKTHEKTADRCAETLRRYKLGQIAVSALTASGVVSSIVIDDIWIKLVTALLSLGSLWISSYMKGFDPGATAQKHRDAAANIWPVRESYLSLLTDLRSGSIDAAEAMRRRDALQERLAAIYKAAPQTNGKAYGDAQAALKDREDLTFSDAEIDAFLPASLRKTSA